MFLSVVSPGFLYLHDNLNQNKKVEDKTDEKEKEANKKDDTFSWSDDEIQFNLWLRWTLNRGSNSKGQTQIQEGKNMMMKYPSVDNENYQNRNSLDKELLQPS